jgi:hypothetical protein
MNIRTSDGCKIVKNEWLTIELWAFTFLRVRESNFGTWHTPPPHLQCVTWNNTVLYLIFIINFVEQSPSWEAYSHSASQEITLLLWKTKVRYRVHKRPPQVPILSHLNPIHSFPPCFSKFLIPLNEYMKYKTEQHYNKQYFTQPSTSPR